MLSASLTSYLLGKRYIGVEHYSLQLEDLTAVLEIQNGKEGLTIVKNNTTDADLHTEKWDKSLAIFLVVNTNKVIQKEIQGTESSDEKLLHRAFPNISWTEFYYEIFRMKSKSIIAISRKSYLDELLTMYSQQKFSIAGVSLGISSLSETINYTPENILLTNTQIISLNEDEQTIQNRSEYFEESYELNGLTIGSRHLLSFSGILKLLTNTGSTSGNILEINQHLRDAYHQKAFFTKCIKIFIAVLLGLLLINFFIFSHYYKKAEEASQNLLLNRSSIESVKKVKERIISKEQKLKNSIEFTSSKSSQVINEIVERIPQSILLSELTYNPLRKKIKENEPILTDEATILISGTTIDNNDFTNWIDSLENLKSITKVTILHFGKNDVNETVFSVKLKLKQDATK